MYSASYTYMYYDLTKACFSTSSNVMKKFLKLIERSETLINASCVHLYLFKTIAGRNRVMLPE